MKELGYDEFEALNIAECQGRAIMMTFAVIGLFAILMILVGPLRRMVNNRIGLDERRNQLRLDIHDLYSSMRRNKTFRWGINDISEFLKGYIPEGVSFEDAENILRNAGFNVLERPGINVPDHPSWPNRSDKYDVIATMLLSSGFLERAELMLGLRPKSSGDYSTVKEIQGAIIIRHL